jgi:hypothetical protein
MIRTSDSQTSQVCTLSGRLVTSSGDRHSQHTKYSQEIMTLFFGGGGGADRSLRPTQQLVDNIMRLLGILTRIDNIPDHHELR